ISAEERRIFAACNPKYKKILHFHLAPGLPFGTAMLRITIHDSSKATTFKLEGKLAGPWVPELEQCWTTATSASHGRHVVADLAGVTFINQAIVESISRKGLQTLCAVVAAALLAAPAFAQTAAPAAAPLRLTLKDAV